MTTNTSGDFWTRTRAKAVIGLFASLIFVNATLLFSVQPMFTKMVLPLLGGTPAVWNTSLMFFQGALLLGYLYAHLTSRRLAPRSQGALHLGLLLLALLFLPVALPVGATPPPGMALPVVWLVGILALSLGLPFVLLSAGAPMFQRWFASTSHPAAGNPYVLYVASNLGSFVALLAYPTLIEPVLRVSEQRIWWLYVFYGLLVLVGGALWVTVRFVRGMDSSGKEMVSTPSIIPSRARRLRWVLLSFAPSSLLLGVTSWLSTDVAAVPLLWVVPLALYLFTFVLVFAERPLLDRRVMLAIQLVIGLALLLLIGITPTKLQFAHIAFHLTGFFVTAMVLHRELADTRPRPEHLTEFYLWMSLGGLLGGAFNVVVAPLIYDRVLEYPLALIIALALRPAAQRIGTQPRQVLIDVALAAGVYVVVLASYEIQGQGRWGTAAMWTLFTVAALTLASFHQRPLRLALGAAALFFAVDGRGRSDGVEYQRRSFFGVYRVQRKGDFLILQSGTTTHGAQNMRRESRREPLTYYARAGPLGDAFAMLTDTTAQRDVALVGLGTGAAACYARPDERWIYYEIDPVVASLATSGKHFTYLAECGPQVRVTLGDARLSLRTAPDSSFDLIVLDAFSSDAIPVHLMTREAVRLYLRKLKPGGTILFHISNRYLNLESVVAQLALDAQLAGAARDFEPTEAQKLQMMYASRWVALSREPVTVAPLIGERGWRVLMPLEGIRLWTDDYSDVLGVLRRK